MSKHTKEPWRTDAPSGFPGDVMAGKEMIARTTITEQSNAKANARRIVACVNACAGISTEVLEQGIDAVFGLAHDMRQERNALEQQARYYEAENGKQAEMLNSVIQQRDELLAAGEKAVSEMKAISTFVSSKLIKVIDFVAD